MTNVPPCRTTTAAIACPAFFFFYFFSLAWKLFTPVRRQQLFSFLSCCPPLRPAQHTYVFIRRERAPANHASGRRPWRPREVPRRERPVEKSVFPQCGYCIRCKGRRTAAGWCGTNPVTPFRTLFSLLLVCTSGEHVCATPDKMD